MILKKALLINGGNKGMELKFDGYRKISEQFMSNYEDNRKDRMPVPLNLRIKFNNLKYFFLTMMGVFPEELTSCLDEYYSKTKDVATFARQEGLSEIEAGDMIMKADSLLQKCVIRGYELRGSEIKIVGTFEHIEGKPYKPALPFINEDDDYSFYQEAYAVIKGLSGMIINYMKEESIELSEMRKILLELQQNNQQDVERINKQTDEENYVELMQKLEGQALIMPLQGSELERMLEEHDAPAKVVSSKSITTSSFDSTEEHTDENTDKDIEEKSDNDSSENVSEENAAQEKEDWFDKAATKKKTKGSSKEDKVGLKPLYPDTEEDQSENNETDDQSNSDIPDFTYDDNDENKDVSSMEDDF